MFVYIEECSAGKECKNTRKDKFCEKGAAKRCGKKLFEKKCYKTCSGCTPDEEQEPQNEQQVTPEGTPTCPPPDVYVDENGGFKQDDMSCKCTDNGVMSCLGPALYVTRAPTIEEFLNKEGVSKVQDALDAYCKDTVQYEHKSCNGAIHARKGLDKIGSGPIWRCYKNLKEIGICDDCCVGDDGKPGPLCVLPDPRRGKYCSRDEEIKAQIAILVPNFEPEPVLDIRTFINLSNVQNMLDAYCKDTVQNEDKSCKGAVHARKGLDKKGSGPIWRCYKNLINSLCKDCCVNDDGKPYICAEPDPKGRKYCSRDADIKAQIALAVKTVHAPNCPMMKNQNLFSYDSVLSQKTDTKEECADLCRPLDNAVAWKWHDATLGQYAFSCSCLGSFERKMTTDGVWSE